MSEDTVLGDEKFYMHAARASLGVEGGSLSDQVDVIEETIERIPDLTFDLAKGLIDSVCKTVLGDLGETVDRSWDTPQLVKKTSNRLSLVSQTVTNASNAEASLKRLTGGLANVVQGLCELRNQHGLSAHGQDARADRLNDRQAKLAAQAADVVASFLYRIHRDALTQAPGLRVYYDDHMDFNQDFDELNEAIVLGDISFEASRVLFMLDPETYRAALLDFQAKPDDDDELAEEAGE